MGELRIMRIRAGGARGMEAGWLIGAVVGGLAGAGLLCVCALRCAEWFEVFGVTVERDRSHTQDRG
jgi:hypothetical protein